MHPSELSAPLSNYLWSGNTTIQPRVWIRAHVRTVTGVSAGGYPIFGAGYAEYEWEVTAAVIGYPKISMERQKWMGDEEATQRQTECTIELESQGGQLAATQTGAVLRRTDLEQARVIIGATVGGQLIEWFSGRVAGMPSEKQNITTLKVIGYLWEALRKPVMYENFGTVIYQGHGTSQGLAFASGETIAQTAHIEACGSHFCAHHGLVTFDGGGRVSPNVSKTGGESIDLTKVDLATDGQPLDLGVYTLTFRDSQNYTISYPSGQTFRSSIYGYTTGAFGIKPEYWVGSNGDGAVFTFKVSLAAVGNPISMAFYLIERALLDNYGAGVTASAFMDVVAWTAAARRFESFIVHVDATNADNSVFENKINSSPMSAATLAQRILDHVGCSLSLGIDGQISITIPYLDNVPAYPNDTTNTILGDGVTIEAGDYLVNWIVCQYGWNGNSYGAKTSPLDLRPNSQSQIVEKIISLPYFKAGQGNRAAEWAVRTFARRFIEKQVVVNYQVHAGVALLAQVGDRVTLVSELLPLLRSNAEIFKVSKTCGPESGQFSAQLIQDHEGPKAEICTALVGAVEIW